MSETTSSTTTDEQRPAPTPHGDSSADVNYGSRGDRQGRRTIPRVGTTNQRATPGRPNLNLESIGSATDKRREQRHTTVDGRPEARGTGPTHRSSDRRLTLLITILK